jgi:hypothetical protein
MSADTPLLEAVKKTAAIQGRLIVDFEDWADNLGCVGRHGVRGAGKVRRRMKIHDQDLWQAQQAEIASRPDHEDGEAFLSFVEAWCDLAEAHLHEAVLLGADGTHVAIEGLRETLEPAQEALGKLPFGWLGQILVCIYTHWEYGSNDAFLASMTPLEQKFMADAYALLEHGLQMEAQKVPDGPPR